jgi:small subunit ribosomal protein S2
MTTSTKTQAENNPAIEELFRVGAHFGYSRSRRHASVKPYLYGVRNGVDIIDLEKTVVLLEEAKAYVAGLAAEGKRVLFVGTKPEAKGVVEAAAKALGLPYVSERWIGGSLTNFGEIKKRKDRMKEIISMKEKGGMEKYTKRERSLIERELALLELNFGGVADMDALPAALFVVDPRAEIIAIEEARKMKIPVIALANSDCSIKEVAYPIVGNDAGVMSVAHMVEVVKNAYLEGKKKYKPAPAPLSA